MTAAVTAVAGVGRGPLRRAPAGAKVLALLALTTSAFVVSSPAGLAALGLVVGAGHVVTRGPRLRFLRFLALVAAVLLAVQWWFLGPTAAGVITLRFVVTVAAAHLLTLTTAVDELVALVERLARPLRRVGLPEAAPERLGLLVGLTVAAVAALTRIADDVGEAARARGLERSVTARLVPLVVRAVRHADELGEALAARGVGDR